MHTLGNLAAFAAWVVLGLIGRHAYRASHRDPWDALARRDRKRTHA